MNEVHGEHDEGAVGHHCGSDKQLEDVEECADVFGALGEGALLEPQQGPRVAPDLEPKADLSGTARHDPMAPFRGKHHRQAH